MIRPGTPEDAEAGARVHVASRAAAYGIEGPSFEAGLALTGHVQGQSPGMDVRDTEDGVRHERPIEIRGVFALEVRYTKHL